ncbi:MAG TPA: hypothetical protein C5S51_06255 [Methanosarcinaceae archaeon]|nr:hypothetical protein [Methanosarcinaceae archaeon]
MQSKEKLAIIFLIVLIVSSLTFIPFYNAFNYYPTIERIEKDLPTHSFKDVSIAKIGQILAVTFNLRVSLNTEVPVLPANQLPIFQGKTSSNILYIDFVNTIEDFNSSTDDICFLVTNDYIAKTRINTGNFHTIEQAKIDNSNEYIIHQVKNGNFVTYTGDYPMSPLGRVRIVDIELVYFDGFDYYPYEYKGKAIYYPTWKITAETSNYGDEIIMMKAMSLTVN